MGGAVSAGEDNDDLIDNLVSADYIKRPHIEKVFRCVDRGDYYLEANKLPYAYRDLAWKQGNLHLSAPCIYSEVLESLDINPGQSFLNLGSGTGYLSTMVGLLLGRNGINHGIEIYEDVIQYANLKLELFKRKSNALDEYEFCEPKFVIGNCLLIDPTTIRQYDRIYCGASCPNEHENYIKNLLKPGGILVMPFNDQLLKITRLTENSWDVRNILPVSFAPIVVPRDEDHLNRVVKLPELYPLSLKEICRSIIRQHLRKVINLEHNGLAEKNLFSKRQQRKSSSCSKNGRKSEPDNMKERCTNSGTNCSNSNGKRKYLCTKRASDPFRAALRLVEWFDRSDFTSDDDEDGDNRSGSDSDNEAKAAGKQSNKMAKDNESNNRAEKGDDNKGQSSNRGCLQRVRVANVNGRRFGQTVEDAVGMILGVAMSSNVDSSSSSRSANNVQMSNEVTSDAGDNEITSQDDEKRVKRSCSTNEEDESRTLDKLKNEEPKSSPNCSNEINPVSSTSSSSTSLSNATGSQSPFKKRPAVTIKHSKLSADSNQMQCSDDNEKTKMNEDNDDIQEEEEEEEKEANDDDYVHVEDNDGGDKARANIKRKERRNTTSSSEGGDKEDSSSDVAFDEEDDSWENVDEHRYNEMPKYTKKVKPKSIDAESYTNYMREKISLLPLPFTLLKYVNYDRDLNRI